LGSQHKSNNANIDDLRYVTETEEECEKNVELRKPFLNSPTLSDHGKREKFKVVTSKPLKEEVKFFLKGEGGVHDFKERRKDCTSDR